MRIYHNLAAFRSWRHLDTSHRSINRSLERLSSGLRINRAADDAAGLSISEKMKAEAAGLRVAQRNAQDAISLIQTAEGALNETHSLLQRMRELALESATGTYTDADRVYLQQEMDQLVEEVSRIATGTEFNSQKLLDGSFHGKFHIGAKEGQHITLSIEDMGAGSLGVAGRALVPVQATYVSLAEGTYTIRRGETAPFELLNTAGKIVATSDDGAIWKHIDSNNTHLTFDVPVTSGTVQVIEEVIYPDQDHGVKIAAYGTTSVTNHRLDLGTYHYDAATGTLRDQDDGVVAHQDPAHPGRFLSSSSGHTVLVAGTALPDGAQIVVAGGIDISTPEAADAAIAIIDKAIAKVSTTRANLGAVQNRLEHLINYLGVAEENIRAALSRIRDADLARELSEFTRTQVLQQAGIAMISHAHLSPRAILYLLN